MVLLQNAQNKGDILDSDAQGHSNEFSTPQGSSRLPGCKTVAQNVLFSIVSKPAGWLYPDDKCR
jgi:hypothetical protein